MRATLCVMFGKPGIAPRQHDPKILPIAPYARDVSHVGQWGTGNIELAIDSMERLGDAERLIRISFHGLG